MSALKVFPRRWVGHRLPATTIRDDFRSVIDDVIAKPEVLLSDDDDTESIFSDMIIHTQPTAESLLCRHRTGPDAKRPFHNGRAPPDEKRMAGSELTGPSAFRDLNSATLRVVSYNVLTDNCIRDGQYVYCPTEIRYMDARHGRILSEIRSIDPDVVCLQEADKEHFRKRLEPEMEVLGYAGINRGTSDGQGLATFWRSSMFELVKQRSSLLSDVINDYIDRNAFTDDMKRSAIEAWSRRPEATLIVHLRHLATGRDIAVCNNHVGWMGLRFPTLQALQVAVALRELVNFVDPVSSSFIFCGDLNSPPSYPAYRLLSRGHLSRKAFETLLHGHCDIDEIDRRNFSVITDAIPDIFHLPLHLESAYVSVLGREPSVTNCDGAHEDGIVRSFCLDYIWYRKLEPVRVLETPSLAVLTEHVALPSTNFPSDHISIAAEFLLT